MSDLLFDIPETKSPRLLWLEKHGIHTRNTGTEADELGDCKAWSAGVGEQGLKCAYEVAYGDTEDEAITQLALKLKIKLWNEEGQS